VAFIGRFRSVRFFFPFGQTIKFLLCEYFFSFRFFSLIGWGGVGRGGKIMIIYSGSPEKNLWATF